jgi:hypothetical protein
MEKLALLASSSFKKEHDHLVRADAISKMVCCIINHLGQVDNFRDQSD